MSEVAGGVFQAIQGYFRIFVKKFFNGAFIRAEGRREVRIAPSRTSLGRKLR
jgi:hypothetical protein